MILIKHRVKTLKGSLNRVDSFAVEASRRGFAKAGVNLGGDHLTNLIGVPPGDFERVDKLEVCYAVADIHGVDAR